MENAGRVEICINGVWGRVCDTQYYYYYDYYYNNVATVVCKQLGYNVSLGRGELLQKIAINREIFVAKIFVLKNFRRVASYENISTRKFYNIEVGKNVRRE